MKWAAIVIDLVEDYFDEELWPGSAIPDQRAALVSSTNRLTTALRNAGIPIIWFRQEFEPDLSDAFPHMVSSGKRYAIRNTRGSSLLYELEVCTTDRILTKNRYSAFFQTELDDVLSELEVDGLVLAGITTAWCVRSTAVDAYQRGFSLVIARDATAGFSIDEHEESLRALGSVIADCKRVEVIVAELTDQIAGQ
jgi:nicotinamidase-related amidase